MPKGRVLPKKNRIAVSWQGMEITAAIPAVDKDKKQLKITATIATLGLLVAGALSIPVAVLTLLLGFFVNPEIAQVMVKLLAVFAEVVK